MKKVEMGVVCEIFEIDEKTLVRWIKCRLVHPMDLEGPYFDEEDLSRIQLITELKKNYNTNDESLEIILHLVDQIHNLTSEVKTVKDKISNSVGKDEY